MTQKNRTQDRDTDREGREREDPTNGYITAMTSVSLPKPHNEGEK